MKITMTMNPETGEIVADADELETPTEWPRRDADVQAKLWDGRDQRLLVDWWDRARPDGAPVWPLLP